MIQPHRTSSNLPELHHYRDRKVCRVLSHEFGVVRPYRTFSVYIVTGETRSAGWLCTSLWWFKHIEPYRTFSNHIITEIARCVEFCHMSFRGGSTVPNLLYLHRYRCNKVCRVLCTCWGYIEYPRTFSNHIITKIARYVEFCHMSSGWFDCTEPSLSTSFTGQTRCAGCLCTCSGWFKHIEPRRIFSNHIITEIARCVEVCHMSSGWFDFTEPSLSTSFTGETRCAGCLCSCSGWLKYIKPTRTFSNHIITEIAKCVEFCHKSSGWFDFTEPYLSTSLQGKQGVQGAYALVRGGSSTSNLVESFQTTSLRR